MICNYVALLTLIQLFVCQSVVGNIGSDRVTDFPLEYVPKNGFGIAHLNFSQGVLNRTFYIVDERYYNRYGTCQFPAGVVNKLQPPPLGVEQPCLPSTYQYIIKDWASPESFNITIEHTYIGSTYTENKIAKIKSGTLDITFIRYPNETDPVPIPFIQLPPSETSDRLAPAGWKADQHLP